MRALRSLEGPGNCSGSLPSGKAGATTLKLFAVSLRTRAGDGLARPPWSHFTTAKKIQEPGLLDPSPFPFVLRAATERTCGPGGHRLPTERPRPARTATPRCYRPTAAVPSSPPSEREPEPGLEPGLEPGPGQPSAAGAQERERPWAARAHTGPWQQLLRPSPL